MEQGDEGATGGLEMGFWTTAGHKYSKGGSEQGFGQVYQNSELRAEKKTPIIRPDFY